MFQGLDHVSNAVQILASRNAMLNQRLYEAANEFEAALNRPDQWPVDLLERARDVQRKLSAKGQIEETVNGMDVSTASQIAGELLDLSVAISAASIHEMKQQITRVPTRKRGRSRRLDISGTF